MNRRAMAAAIAALMGVSFAGATAWRPSRRLADQRPKIELETMFPKAFGTWRVDDRMPVQLIAPDAKALLDKIYNQTLSRTYVNDTGQRIMLSVAYGGDQSDATRAHRPEVCYPAQGFQVIASSDGLVQGLEQPLRVRRLVTRLGPRTEPITYWVMVGEQVTLSGTEQKLAQLSYSVRGTVPDGMLVRISSIDPVAADAYRTQQQFIGDMARAIAPPLRPLVMGRAAAIEAKHS